MTIHKSFLSIELAKTWQYICIIFKELSSPSDPINKATNTEASLLPSYYYHYLNLR